ncbi:hypothetical protein [Corallococcus sicarius]|uniref:hypothetical protein n=1 Tax=Corallococcus sicarius TaxID=2316726 RepID=UPI0011C399B4|nr:hypothetical protein [Corallococcus sicarius]
MSEFAVLAEDLEFDDAPMEEVVFSSSSGGVRMRLDLHAGGSVGLEFRGVRAMRMVPSVFIDRNRLRVNGVYRRSVLVLERSEWLGDLVRASVSAGEPVSCRLSHYVVPSDDWVWELLASDCSRVDE